jgi:predicted naringenin-chalcone synthase
VAQRFCRALFQEAFPDIERLLPVFSNALVQTRYFSAPPEWFESEHSFAEKNQLYIQTALEVGEAAILACLDRAGLGPQDIDHFFFISSTGLATPSVDARLINMLKLRPNIRRTPIWGLGCAGGVAGLSRAYEYTSAFPRERALMLALELCGLTFQRNDLSKSNLIATSLRSVCAGGVHRSPGHSPWRIRAYDRTGAGFQLGDGFASGVMPPVSFAALIALLPHRRDSVGLTSCGSAAVGRK